MPKYSKLPSLHALSLSSKNVRQPPEIGGVGAAASPEIGGIAAAVAVPSTAVVTASTATSKVVGLSFLAVVTISGASSGIYAATRSVSPTVLWTSERNGGIAEPTEECFHKYSVENDLSAKEANYESVNFSVWRTTSNKNQRLALVYDGKVVASATVGDSLTVQLEDGFDEKMATSLFESHLRAFDTPIATGEYMHRPSKQRFVASEVSRNHFVASNYVPGAKNNAPAHIDYDRRMTYGKSSTSIATRVYVRFKPVDLDHKTNYDYTANYSNAPEETTFLMQEDVSCIARSSVTLSIPSGKVHRVDLKREFEAADGAKGSPSVEPINVQRRLSSDVPVSPFLPNGLQWFSDKIALHYTIDAIRFLGLDFYLRVTASLYYTGQFAVYVIVGESNLGIDLEFYAYRSSETGGAMITLLDKDILDIDPIPLFSIGPLTLELKPGLRLLSKLNLASNVNQIYLALRNEVHVFAEVTISTPCMVVIKFKLGVRVSGRILRLEHQFGFYSQSTNTDIATAFAQGTACMELRYAKLPFSIVVQPICRICVGFLRCRSCVNCLGSLLSNLGLYLTFGSMTTNVIFSSCNDGLEFTQYPPSLPPPPSPPPSPPNPPPPPWIWGCYEGPCNDDAECRFHGQSYGCNPLVPSGVGGGIGGGGSETHLGICYNYLCEPRPPAIAKPPRPSSVVNAPPPP